MWRKMFSSTTTELSISREKASARPPRIMALTVLSPSESAMNVARADSGIERNTRHVARMLPRKTRIISAGQNQTDGAFVEQVLDGVADEHRLVENHLRDQLLRHIEQTATRRP